jgi:putative mRNA 3-end processing factor
LLSSIKTTGAEKVICTHGYTDIFSRYLRELGYDARTEQTQYGAEETIEVEEKIAVE